MTDSAPQMSQSPTEPQTETVEEGGVGEFVRTIVCAIIIAMVIRTFAFEPFNIPSPSMVPTLLVGDYLFVSKYTYGYGDYGTFWGVAPFSGRILEQTQPHRGDVIVFKWPGDNSTDYIKRLIGLPGDRVQMKEGILYINGQPVPRAELPALELEPGEPVDANVVDYKERLPDGPEHTIRKVEGDHNPLDSTQEFVVPEHHYFFMGDNRDNSADSRAPNGHVGYVAEENLVGKAQVIFFSLSDDTSFWQFWKWPRSIRWDRLFRKIQ